MMVEFSAPYLIPSIFLLFVFCIGFGAGALITEVRLMTSKQCDSYAELKWLLLILPCAIGVFLILWWPTVQLGGG